MRYMFSSQGNPGDIPNHLNEFGPRFGTAGPPGPPVSSTDILKGLTDWHTVRPGRWLSDQGSSCNADFTGSSLQYNYALVL